MKGRALSRIEKQLIVERYRGGVPLKEIGCAASTASSLARQYGLPMRCRRMSEETIRQIEEACAVGESCDELGVSRYQMRRIARRCGFTLGPSSYRPRSRQPRVVAEVLTALTIGLPINHIAAQCRIAAKSVRRIRDQADAELMEGVVPYELVQGLQAAA